MKKIGLGLVICLAVLTSVWWIVGKNVLFHSDIARDFYLMREIQVSGKPTLLGPRSGGIPGLFHGPLWVYLNLPVFLVFLGNPLALAFFWLVLHVLTVVLVWRLTGKVWAGAIYALVAALDVHSFNNPQGAVILAPVWFYLVNKFWEKPKSFTLFWAFLVTGFLIQFQAAFGGPMLFLLLLLSIIQMVKNKNWKLGLESVGLVLPLMTYLGFELRHDFLMTRSVFTYLQKTGGGMGWVELIKDRLKMVLYEGFFMVGKYWWGALLTTLGLVLAGFKDNKVKLFWGLWIGFWLISLVFKSRTPVWYYNQFLPIIVMVLVSTKYKAKKLILTGLILASGIYNIRDIAGYKRLPQDGVWTSWKSLKVAADLVKENCGKNFGLYTYTPDLFGYPLRYAVEYEMGFSDYVINEKKAVTCILGAPEVAEHPEGMKQWLKNEVKIERKPDFELVWANGIKLQKYELSEKEQQIKSNPLMIKDVFFR